MAGGHAINLNVRQEAGRIACGDAGWLKAQRILTGTQGRGISITDISQSISIGVRLVRIENRRAVVFCVIDSIAIGIVAGNGLFEIPHKGS